VEYIQDCFVGVDIPCKEIMSMSVIEVHGVVELVFLIEQTTDIKVYRP